MSGDLTSLSRFISLILRHNPDTVGLSLDRQRVCWYRCID